MAFAWTKTGTANDSVNTAPTTGAQAVFFFKEMLKNSAGYSHVRSSDGTTMSTGSDQITSGGSGANGFANNSAYWIGQDAAGHQVSMQRGTTNLVWRVKVSHSAHFTGGSPSATVTPSATDEQLIRGGGSDASPTFTTSFGTDGTYHLHCGGDSSNGTWWYYCTASSGGAHQSHGWFLPMLRGSYSDLDVAPWIMDWGNTTAPSASNVNGTPFGSGYFKKGLAGETFVAYNSGNWAGFLFGSAQPIIPASASDKQITTDPYTGNDRSGFPIPIARSNNLSQPGWKGFLDPTSVRFNGTFRAQFDTEDVTAAAWAQSTAYTADKTVSANGNVYRCLTAGTSSSSGAGPSGTSNSITDGTVTWTFVEPVARYTQLDVVLLRSPTGVTLS